MRELKEVLDKGSKMPGQNRKIRMGDLDDAINNLRRHDVHSLWDEYQNGRRGAAIELLVQNVRATGCPANADSIVGVLISGGWQGISGIEELDLGYYNGCIPWGDDTGSIACSCINRASERNDDTLMLNARFALQAWVEWKMGLGEKEVLR